MLLPLLVCALAWSVVVVVVEQVLERMGWHTATAENGREALAKAALFQPQLVIMDRHMPVSECCGALMLFR